MSCIMLIFSLLTLLTQLAGDGAPVGRAKALTGSLQQLQLLCVGCVCSDLSVQQPFLLGCVITHIYCFFCLSSLDPDADGQGVRELHCCYRCLEGAAGACSRH